MPSYKFWEAPFYGIRLKVYDALAGKAGLGPTAFLSRRETVHSRMRTISFCGNRPAT